jgi:hypothetical protein
VQGDLLYAASSTTVGRLADEVAGNALISGGVGGDPAWGKIGLGTHVSGTLPVGNGGTGATTLTGYVFGNGTGAFTASTSIPNAATTATSANTGSAIVARDGSGNFSAGTITASLNGNASTATTAANVNNGALSLAVSGTGLSGSASFTANQSGNSTFTVTSNATNANTGGAIVARDGSGNFSAGTITASLSGNAATATTAGSISGFNNPTTAATANTIAYRDASGDIAVRELVMTVAQQTFTPSSLVAIYPTTNQAVKVDATGARAFLNVPTRTGGDASGTWGINITGSAGSATSATFLNSSNYINQTGSAGSWNADFQNTPAGTTRYSGDVGANGTNGPGGSWWIQQNFRHTNSSNFWGTQVAWGWEDNANRLATRNVTGGSFGGWVYYLNSSNFTSFAMPSGSSATNSVDVRAPIFYDANNTGYYLDPNSTSQLSYVLADNWFRPQGGTGVYWQSYGRGIRAADNEFSYGNIGTYDGGLNGWRGYGIWPNNCILMSNGGTHGLYSPSGGIWLMQMDTSGNVTFNGNVTAYSDLRLKENVREIDNVVDRRDALAKSAIKYERDGRTRIGYGAQTLRNNGCAEFVMEADDALKLATGMGTLSVDYGETAAILAVTSKMTDDRLAALEAKVAQLMGV